MRYLYLVAILLISSAANAESRMPCQYIDFDELVDDALPYFHRLASDEMVARELRKQQIDLLKQCIEKYAVCIVEMPPKVSIWFNKELKAPIDDNFDPVKRDLAFGLIQYTDKTTGEQICITAQSGDAQALPWLAYSWVIGNGLVKKYDICSKYFHMAMTPKNVYDALLASHQRAVTYLHWIKSYNLSE